jgi:FixJ family two-component response regulator
MTTTNEPENPELWEQGPVVRILEEDVSVRAAYEQMIHDAGWCAQSFGSAKELLASPRTMTPGCLILNVLLPDMDGLLLQKLLADRIELPVIFSTEQGDVSTIVRAMKAGALEFMTRPFTADVMVRAIRAAIEHSRIALRRLTGLQALRARYASLSCRERQVMALVTEGRVNKLIGRELGISEMTVKAHRGSLVRKMHAASVPDLVRMAAALDLTPSQPSFGLS